MTSTPHAPDLIRALSGVVGVQYVLTAPDDMAPYLTDWRGRYRGAARCIVLPETTADVAAVVRICGDAGVPMVPQGGNTGLCGGATADESGQAVVINLSRLRRVRALDPINNTMTVEAGCTLAEAQAAAQSVDRLFPLALASEGSCQIGGNLATNAGGVQVLRYGNARELTLGLEVVLPDGTVWEGLRGLRKDNTGYDLKHLFIGAEGTLGIITAAVLKLFPQPRNRVTAWLNVASPAAAVALLARARTCFDAHLTAFELVSDVALGLVLKHRPAYRRPGTVSAWYVLAEFSDADGALIEAWLAAALAEGGVSDGVLAQSETQISALWSLRESISEAQKIEGVSIKHDIAVPVSRIPAFLEAAEVALRQAFPGGRIVTFGHVGDGNLHFNLFAPEGQGAAVLLNQQEAVNRIVYDVVVALGGTVSAEHGIGRLKRGEIVHYKSDVEIALMRAIKASIDPRGLLNPGVLL